MTSAEQEHAALVRLAIPTSLAPHEARSTRLGKRPCLVKACRCEATHVEMVNGLVACDGREPPLLISGFMDHNVDGVAERPFALLSNTSDHALIVGGHSPEADGGIESAVWHLAALQRTRSNPRAPSSQRLFHSKVKAIRLDVVRVVGALGWGDSHLGGFTQIEKGQKV